MSINIDYESRFFSQVHESLKNDAAYILSIAQRDICNMQLVLRGHGYTFSIDRAASQLDFAIERSTQ